MKKSCRDWGLHHHLFVVGMGMASTTTLELLLYLFPGAETALLRINHRVATRLMHRCPPRSSLHLGAPRSARPSDVRWVMVSFDLKQGLCDMFVRCSWHYKSRLRVGVRGDGKPVMRNTAITGATYVYSLIWASNIEITRVLLLHGEIHNSQGTEHSNLCK